MIYLYNIILKYFDLPQQSPPQQGRNSVVFPTQSRPPANGGGLLQDLVLLFRQLVSQVPQSLHSVQTPSIGVLVLKMKKKTITVQK